MEPPFICNPPAGATFEASSEAYRHWTSVNNAFHLTLLGLHRMFGVERMPDSVIWMMETLNAPNTVHNIARAIAEWVKNEAMARGRLPTDPPEDEPEEATMDSASVTPDV